MSCLLCLLPVRQTLLLQGVEVNCRAAAAGTQPSWISWAGTASDWGCRTPGAPGTAPIEAFCDAPPCSLVFITVLLLTAVRKVLVKDARGFFPTSWWWGWVQEIDDWPVHLKKVLKAWQKFTGIHAKQKSMHVDVEIDSYVLCQSWDFEPEARPNFSAPRSSSWSTEQVHSSWKPPGETGSKMLLLEMVSQHQ